LDKGDLSSISRLNSRCMLYREARKDRRTNAKCHQCLYRWPKAKV